MLLQKELTSEQYEKLIPLERHLNRAYYGQYTIGLTTKEAQVVFGIYNEVYGTKEKSFNCAHCRLRILKALGELYYKKANVKPNKPRKKKKENGKQDTPEV